jgi:hypothetical protein
MQSILNDIVKSMTPLEWVAAVGAESRAAGA